MLVPAYLLTYIEGEAASFDVEDSLISLNLLKALPTYIRRWKKSKNNFLKARFCCDDIEVGSSCSRYYKLQWLYITILYSRFLFTIKVDRLWDRTLDWQKN